MAGLVYLERNIREHPTARAILERARPDSIVEIERYGEVFNPKAQNFRLQKQNPALIVAEKHGKHILPAPEGYGIGGEHNYYFSHMMNCIYDCRYCFLQGMYQSANHVVFVNYDDFFEQISDTAVRHDGQDVWFFSGYDCDSLALEPVTRFMSHCLDYFATAHSSATTHSTSSSSGAMTAPSNACLEIRTKSTQIRELLARDPLPNCVVAYSLSPQPVVEELEHRTPSLEKRITALEKLQKHGWPIGLRFDPLIAAENFENLYAEMFDEVFSTLDANNIHSVSLGSFRLPKPFYRKVIKLYPEEPMFAVDMQPTGEKAIMAYPEELESGMMDYCQQRILEHIKTSRFFPCNA